MTAAELLAHPEFLAFCSLWEQDRRCPLVLGDWLRDRGLDGHGAGADWAATYRDRRQYDGFGRATGRRCGPCPWSTTALREWAWFAPLGFPDAARIPAAVLAAAVKLGDMPDFVDGYSDAVYYRTFPAAVAGFLCGWAVAGHRYKTRGRTGGKRAV